MKVNLLALLLLIVIPVLLAAGGRVPAKEEQPLRAIPELVSTRYCYGDAEVYAVWLTLRVKYINRSDKILILDKEIGKAWYEAKVARSLDDLAAGKHEYNPHTDWFFTDKDKLPDKPSADSPGADFAVLSPGGTFESGTDATVAAQYENPKDFPGSIRPGVHVLQVELSA